MLTTLSKVTTFIYLGHFGLNLSKVKERNQQQSEYRQLFDDIMFTEYDKCGTTGEKKTRPRTPWLEAALLTTAPECHAWDVIFLYL